MKTRLGKISLVILFAFSFYAQAASMTFTSDANIQAGDSWSSVSIYDSPPAHTAVTMTGGSVTDSMGVYNASTFNMSAGHVNALSANDQSTVNISGDSVHVLGVSSNATASISNNASVSMADTYGVLNVYGGTIGQLYGWETSTINVYSGTINNDLFAEESSVFSIYGGTIDHLGAGGSSVVNLRGGNITNWLGASSTINVFGYNLAKTNTGGAYGDGQITGFWQDGLPFTISLRYSSTYSAVNLIPEPATLLLFGLGVLLLKKSH